MKSAITILLLSFLFGCATAYQKNGLMGGFTTTQLDENIFTVTFKGNAYTARDKANDYALLRSAEVTLENGFTYFTIVDAKQYAKTGSYTTPTRTTTNVNASTYGTVNLTGNNAIYNANTHGTATTTTSGGQTYKFSKPRTSNTIVCFNNKPEGFAYNAKFLSKSLKEKYDIEPVPYKPIKQD